MWTHELMNGERCDLEVGYVLETRGTPTWVIVGRSKRIPPSMWCMVGGYKLMIRSDGRDSPYYPLPGEHTAAALDCRGCMYCRKEYR